MSSSYAYKIQFKLPFNYQKFTPKSTSQKKSKKYKIYKSFSILNERSLISYVFLYFEYFDDTIFVTYILNHLV